MKGYSSKSSVSACNVLSGIEVDLSLFLWKKFLPKQFIKCRLNKFSNPTLQKFFTKKFDITNQKIYLLSARGINRIKDVSI